MTAFDVAMLILRVGIGLVILAHGVNHARGRDRTTKWFGSIGFRSPGMQWFFSTATEIGVGVLLVVGALGQVLIQRTTVILQSKIHFGLLCPVFQFVYLIAGELDRQGYLFLETVVDFPVTEAEVVDDAGDVQVEFPNIGKPVMGFGEFRIIGDGVGIVRQALRRWWP